MPDRTEATMLALDAYEQHLFGDLANGHRTDRAEAQAFLHSLVTDLIRYGEGNHLNVTDILDATVQAHIDRGGALSNPRYSFRLNTEVQYRDHDTAHHRGFITKLTSDGPRQEAECVLRVPGVIDPQHTNTSQLEPATRMAPLLTHTCGIVSSALEAEDTVIEIIRGLPRQDHDADPQVRADLAEISTALATWSGTKPQQVLRHLQHLADNIPHSPDDQSFAARRAAAAFPNNIAALLAGEQPKPAQRSRPQPTAHNPHPRRM